MTHRPHFASPFVLCLFLMIGGSAERLAAQAASADQPVLIIVPDSFPRPGTHPMIIRDLTSRQDDIIVLPSIPGTLARVLTPRLLRPSQLISRTEASHANALGSAVDRRRHRQLASH